MYQLDQFDKVMATRLQERLPKDIPELENLVVQHKDFETSMQAFEPQVEALQLKYQQTSPQRRTKPVEAKMSSLNQKWDNLWSQSHAYVER